MSQTGFLNENKHCMDLTLKNQLYKRGMTPLTDFQFWLCEANNGFIPTIAHVPPLPQTLAYAEMMV